MVSENDILLNKFRAKEAIYLFVGQCGCQIGSSLWALFNREHGLSVDGYGETPSNKNLSQNIFNAEKTSLTVSSKSRDYSYMEIEDSGKFVPRTLFMDLEPMVIDEIQSGVYRALFHKDWNFFKFSQMGDGSSIFPRAYNAIGRFVLSDLMDSIRHLVEKTDHLRIFNMTRSYGGATGSGLGSLLLENLLDNYPKVIIAETNVLNSSMKEAQTLEPYNSLFGIESSSNCSNVSVLYNNKKLHTLCFTKLGIKSPRFVTINQLLSYSVSGIYSTERFPGYGSCNIESIITNIIPFPRVQFPICSIAPITRKDVIRYERNSRPSDLTNSILSNDHTMFDMDLDSGTYISCCMIYRGLVSPCNIAQNHHSLLVNKRVKFLEWSAGAIKNGHSPLRIMDMPNLDFGSSELSILMLANHTNVNNAFAEQSVSVHNLLKKKAFMHWYFKYGMEEDDFKDALENLLLLTLDYKEMENKSADNFSSKEFKSTVAMENVSLLKSKPKEKPLFRNSFQENLELIDNRYIEFDNDFGFDTDDNKENFLNVNENDTILDLFLVKILSDIEDQVFENIFCGISTILEKQLTPSSISSFDNQYKLKNKYLKDCQNRKLEAAITKSEKKSSYSENSEPNVPIKSKSTSDLKTSFMKLDLFKTREESFVGSARLSYHAFNSYNNKFKEFNKINQENSEFTNFKLFSRRIIRSDSEKMLYRFSKPKSRDSILNLDFMIDEILPSTGLCVENVYNSKLDWSPIINSGTLPEFSSTEIYGN